MHMRASDTWPSLSMQGNWEALETGDSLSTCREAIIYRKACKNEATRPGRSPMQFDD